MRSVWTLAERHKNMTAALLLVLLAIVFFNAVLWPADGQVMGGHDMRGMFFPYYDAVGSALRQGRLPFWEPALFNGFPFMAQPQQNVFYPPLWPIILLPTNLSISLYMFLHLIAGGLGMYFLVRIMGGRWLPAVLAALAFAFSGLLAGRLWAGHPTLYALDMWVPWMIWALVWSTRKGSWWRAALAGLPLGMALMAGHFPSFLYAAMIYGAFVVYLLWTNKGRGLLIIRQTAIMSIMGVALAAVQLVPFLQLSATSMRLAEADYNFATEFSFPPAHLVTLILPEYFGEPSRVGYWSVPSFEELAYYAGLLSLLGLVLALRRPTKLVWFYILLMVVGLMLALGRYGILYPLAYEYLPLFRIVRAPGRAAFIYLFAVVALLGHALSNWMNMPREQRVDQLSSTLRWTLAVIVVAGVAALAAVGAVFMSIHPTDTSGRLWHQLGGYALAILLLLAGGGLLWAFLESDTTNRLRRTVTAIGLVILVVVDLWLFAYKFARLEPVTPDALWTDARNFIGETDQRVVPWGVSIFDQNGAMQVGLNSVFGYDSLEPANHVALASSVPDPRSSAYDVLAARYVIAPTQLDGYDDGERPLTLLTHDGAAWVYERARSLPVARIVHKVEIMADNQQAIARLHAPDFDPAQTAILAQAPDCVLGQLPSQEAMAEIVAHEDHFWQIRTVSETPGILLLAETDYPGWRVQVDGLDAQSLTAYTTIRGVCVPAGEHIVAWEFVPTVYAVGGVVTILALLFVLVAAVVALRERRAVA